MSMATVKWQNQRLKNVTTKIGSGATPRGGQGSYKADGIPLIRSLNVYDLHFSYDGLAFIDVEQADELANVEVKQGDVLLNITGASVCRCTSVPNELVPARVNQHVSIVRADGVDLDGKYLKYVLVSPTYKNRLLGLATTGATREALTKSDIENFEIDLPLIQTQSRIASVLSSYDDLIENNEKRIRILEEMAQRLYAEWFVKFKFPGHEKVRIVESDTGFGKIPEGWEVKKLGDIADIRWGDTSTTKQAYTSDGFDAYSASGLDGMLNHFDYNQTGIVLSAIGANCGLTWLAKGKWSCIKNTIRILEKTHQICIEYLFLVVSQPNYWKRRGAAQPFISQTDAKLYPTIVPDFNVMNKFSFLIKPVYEEIDLLRKKNKSTSSIRDLLIPQLVTGKRSLK